MATVTSSPVNSALSACVEDELPATLVPATIPLLEPTRQLIQRPSDDSSQGVFTTVPEPTIGFIIPDKRAAQGSSPAEASFAHQQQVADVMAVIPTAVNSNTLASVASKQNSSLTMGKPALKRSEQDQSFSAGATSKKITAIEIPQAPTAVDQLATLIQAGVSSTVTTSTIAQVEPGGPGSTFSVSVKNTEKENLKDVPKDGTGAELPETSSTFASGTVPIASSTSIADHSYQAQDAIVSQMVTPLNLTVPPHVQSVSSAIPSQTITSFISSDSHTAKTSDAPTSIAVPVEQPLPAINAAKLIQNIGQTEMHVGMHTAEFGNISIRTSSTSDLISAQISLDHSDLAKVLATHVPEIQAKLGGNQTGNVQIDMNPSASSAGSSNSSSNGSSEDSQRARQQQNGTIYSNRNSREEVGQYMPSVVAMKSSGPNSRLDVHI